MKTVLVKCGGSILDELSTGFFNSLKELKKQGYAIVIVHGGGPDINRMLENLNIEPEYENGLRKTNKQVLNVVEMVLSGQTNRKLVQKLEENGLSAIGLNGSDLHLLEGEFLNRNKLGYVGDVKKVNKRLIEMFLEKGFIPVITPIAVTREGEKLNVNADYAAVAVANALEVDHCLFVTDVEGIIIKGKVQRSIHMTDIDQYIAQGEIRGGMIPKVKSAVSAIQKGMESVMIVAGKKSFFCNNQWNGTKIYMKESVLS